MKTNVIVLLIAVPCLAISIKQTEFLFSNGTTNNPKFTSKIQNSEHLSSLNSSSLMRELTQLTEKLRGYVHVEYIDFTSFLEDESGLQEQMNLIENYTKSQKLHTEKALELTVSRWFLHCMHIYSIWWKFRKCKLWGLDLVDGFGSLSIRVLTLFWEVHESQIPESEILKLNRNFNSYKHRFEVLQQRAEWDFEYSDVMRKVLVSLEKNAAKSFEILEVVRKHLGSFSGVQERITCLEN